MASTVPFPVDPIDVVLEDHRRRLIDCEEDIRQTPAYLLALTDQFVSDDRVPAIHRSRLVRQLLARERDEVELQRLDPQLIDYARYGTRPWFDHFGDDVVAHLLEGRYALEGKLGDGGMGRVYRARNLNVGNRLEALKVILPRRICQALSGDQRRVFIKRFDLEAEALSHIHHPTLPAMWHREVVRGLRFFTMEFIHGQTLEQVIEAEGPADVGRVARWIAPIAQLLDQYHAAGIVHRDLHPGNLMRRLDDGTIVLIDFGLARLLDASAPLTGPAQGFGRLGFCPREQLIDAARTDQTADVFTLGATLYFLVTGKPPFEGGWALDTIVPPNEINPGVPAAFAAVCMRCLEADPARRYPDMRELHQALTPFQQPAGTTVIPTPLEDSRHEESAPTRSGPRPTPDRQTRRAAVLRLVGLVASVATGAGRVGNPDVAVGKQVAAGRGLDWGPLQAKARSLSQAYLAEIARFRNEDGWLRCSLVSGDEYVEVYAHVRALYACLTCPALTKGQRSTCVNNLLLPFNRNAGEPAQFVYLEGEMAKPMRTVGWSSRQQTAYTIAEPVAWVAAALAVAYRSEPRGFRRDTLAAAHRKAVAMLSHYRATAMPGGWYTYVDQEDENRPSNYTTALVLQALLEARQAELPWAVDRQDKRDQLLAQTARFLLNRFRTGGPDAGWPGRLDGRSCPADDGLSLNVYHLLLRAGREGAITNDLSAVASAAATHLRRCHDRRIDHPDHQCELAAPLVRPNDGRPDRSLLSAVEQPVFLWHPHAILTAVELARREGQADDPHAGLTHLVSRLGDQRLTNDRKEKWLFRLAEGLMGLSAVAAI